MRMIDEDDDRIKQRRIGPGVDGQISQGSHEPNKLQCAAARRIGDMVNLD